MRRTTKAEEEEDDKEAVPGVVDDGVKPRWSSFNVQPVDRRPHCPESRAMENHKNKKNNDDARNAIPLLAWMEKSKIGILPSVRR